MIKMIKKSKLIECENVQVNVEIVSTGHQGGDIDYDGKTSLRFNIGETSCFEIVGMTDTPNGGLKQFELTGYGDDEFDALLAAFRFAACALQEIKNEQYKSSEQA